MSTIPNDYSSKQQTGPTAIGVGASAVAGAATGYVSYKLLADDTLAKVNQQLDKDTFIREFKGNKVKELINSGEKEGEILNNSAKMQEITNEAKTRFENLSKLSLHEVKQYKKARNIWVAGAAIAACAIYAGAKMLFSNKQADNIRPGKKYFTNELAEKVNSGEIS